MFVVNDCLQNSKPQCVKLPCPAGPLPPCGPEEEPKLVVCCPKCERGKIIEGTVK